VSIIAQLLNKKRIFKDHPFVYVDAGCSNTDNNKFTHFLVQDFKDDLKIHGFDPMISECERLQKVFSNQPGTHHFDSVFLVGTPEFREKIKQEEKSNRNDNFWERSWTKYCMDTFLTKKSEKYVSFETVYSDVYITIDECCSKYSNIDFMKIDVDQPNFGALEGSQNTLIEKNIWAVELEVNFQGYSGSTCNNIFTVGQWMRERGYTLFAIKDILHYSRKHFPSGFKFSQFAQTHDGQIRQCDCLFIKDIGGLKIDEKDWDETTIFKILKLCCLFEFYGLADCAVELLFNYKEKINAALLPTEYTVKGIIFYTKLFKMFYDMFLSIYSFFEVNHKSMFY